MIMWREVVVRGEVVIQGFLNVGIAAVAFLALGACQSNSVPEIRVQGWVELSEGGFTESDHRCTPYSDDLYAGAPVVISDSDGVSLATMALGDGWPWRLSYPEGDVWTRCLLHFAASVPGGHAEYGLTIAGRDTIWMDAGRLRMPGLAIRFNR